MKSEIEKLKAENKKDADEVKALRKKIKQREDYIREKLRVGRSRSRQPRKVMEGEHYF